MKDKAGHANASITKLAGGTTRFNRELIRSISREKREKNEGPVGGWVGGWSSENVNVTEERSIERERERGKGHWVWPVMLRYQHTMGSCSG